MRIGTYLFSLVVFNFAVIKGHACDNYDNAPFYPKVIKNDGKFFKFQHLSPPKIRKADFKIRSEAQKKETLCYYTDIVKISLEPYESTKIGFEQIGIAFIVLDSNINTGYFFPRHVFRVNSDKNGNYFIRLRYRFNAKKVSVKFKLLAVSPNLYMSLPSPTYHLRYDGLHAELKKVDL